MGQRRDEEADCKGAPFFAYLLDARAEPAPAITHYLIATSPMIQLEVYAQQEVHRSLPVHFDLLVEEVVEEEAWASLPPSGPFHLSLALTEWITEWIPWMYLHRPRSPYPPCTG